MFQEQYQSDEASSVLVMSRFDIKGDSLQGKMHIRRRTNSRNYTLHKQSYCQYGPINPFKIVGHPGTRTLGEGPLARGRDWQYISDLMGRSSAQGTKEVGRGGM